MFDCVCMCCVTVCVCDCVLGVKILIYDDTNPSFRGSFSELNLPLPKFLPFWGLLDPKIITKS